MAKVLKSEQGFEEAFDKIAMSTWNRPRTSSELREFVRQHHDALVDAEVEL